MDRIKLLPHWCLSDNDPAFYDTESKTAIEQTASLYMQIKKLIDDYNTFADEVNSQIEEYINSTNKNYDEFKADINKLVHDYIITLDSKIAHQDRVIADALEDLKNTLNEYAKTLNGELQEKILKNEADILSLQNETADSGWLKAELTESFKPYNDVEGNSIFYRKIGKIVQVIGKITPTSDIEGTYNLVNICTLPAGFRPKGQLVKLCRGNTKNTWVLEIKTGGGMSFSAYGVTELAVCKAGTALSVDQIFICQD